MGKSIKIEVKELMDENEMLSHIFLGCIPYDELAMIRDKFIGEKDWNEESVKIPVELKIGGINVNPKTFFDEWKKQMSNIVLESVQKEIATHLSQRAIRIQEQLAHYENIFKEWENEINWEVENPLISKK
jgi:hypothetical protein